MNHAIRIHRHGGPEVLSWEPHQVGSPGAGEVRLIHRAIGVNFIDVYHRSGLYLQALPFIPGVEGAGVVDAVGPGVVSLSPGDRVAYANVTGGYSEARLIAADRLVKLPERISDSTAAAMMVRGLTVEFLIRRTYPVRPGDWAVVHAAAGGTGSIMVQWLKVLGARVIGVAGSAEKCAYALGLGADHVLESTGPEWAGRVRDLTSDTGGAHVVYDGVGKDTFVTSLGCLRPRGMMVSFGNASGPAPPIEPVALARGGSLYLTRPTLGHYIGTRAELEASAEALFAAVSSGQVRIAVGQSYPLHEAAGAQRALEGRRTMGSTVLTVSS